MLFYPSDHFFSHLFNNKEPIYNLNLYFCNQVSPMRRKRCKLRLIP